MKPETLTIKERFEQIYHFAAIIEGLSRCVMRDQNKFDVGSLGESIEVFSDKILNISDTCCFDIPEEKAKSEPDEAGKETGRAAA